MESYKYDMLHCANCREEIKPGMSFITKTDIVNHQIQTVKYCTKCAMLYIDGGILRQESGKPEMRMPSTHVETGSGYGRE